MERWKCPEGYEGLYMVSSAGRVFSLITNQYLSATKSSTGYHHVQLYKNKTAKTWNVHVLVASAFLPKTDDKFEVNHKDGNKSNNDASNLEWVSKSENQKHAINHNLRTKSPMFGKFGNLNHRSKPIIQYDLTGNFIQEWSSLSEAARSVGCKVSAISACSKGDRKSAAGFIWKYKSDPDFPKTITVNIPPYNGQKKWKQKNPRDMHRIMQSTKDGKLVKVWNNYREIVDTTGYNNGNIYKAISGKYKSAYGYVWRYAD